MKVSWKRTASPRGAGAGRGAGVEPAREALAGEARQLAVAMDAAPAMQQRPRRPQRREAVGQRRRATTPAAQRADAGEGAVAQRDAVLGVALTEHLVLDLRHVDAGGALGLAGLALDAEVERLGDAVAGHVGGGQAAVERLAQQVGPPARRVLLVAGDHEGGAHGAVELAAGALPVALLQRPGEAAVGAEVEQGGGRLVDGLRPQTQVVGEGRRVDDLARVEQALGVEGALQVAEGADQRGAEQPLHEDAPHDAVAVLAAEAAAELDDEVGDLRGDPGGHRQAVGPLEIHLRADVQAALAGVAVVGGARAVRLHDGVEAGHEAGQLLRRDGRVLDEGDRLGVALDAHQEAQPGGAQPPHRGLLGGVGGRDRRGAEAPRGEIGRERVEPLPHRGGVVAVELHDQQRARVAADERRQRREAGMRAAAFDDRRADQLRRRRAVRQHRHHRLGGGDHGVEVQGGQAGEGRARHEAHGRLRDDGERALGAHDQGHKVAGIPQHRVEVVARHPARDVGEAPPDLLGVGRRQGVAGAVDRAFEVGPRALFGERGGVERCERRERAVGQHGLQRDDVVGRLAVEARVRPAGVVADAAADRRAVRGRGVDGVVQAVLAGGGAELRQHDARLHAGRARPGVDGEDAAHVRGEVEHDGVIHALPRQAGAAAARQHRDPVPPGDAQHVLHVGRRAREDDGDGLHLVDRGVGGVEQAVGAFGAHVVRAAAQAACQLRRDGAQRAAVAVEQGQRRSHGVVRAVGRAAQHGPSRRGGEGHRHGPPRGRTESPPAGCSR